MSSILRLSLFVALSSSALAQQPTREEKVRADRQKVEAEGFWIYNDLPKAFAEARRTGKPLLVVLRCIPCEECVKLDDDLVDNDPLVRPLLEKFVCVRQVSTNGLDLSLFQFDTDQSFAAFLLNADGTVYGRFGTRSHRTEWVGDVSLLGLAKALQAALELHAGYPANKAALEGKRGHPPAVASPEQFPSLKDRYTSSLNYTGNVVQSCIHCHQIGDAQREMHRATGKPIPEDLLFPYPHPAVVGLTLDPRDTALVKEVAHDSAAQRAGLQPGDLIEQFNGQSMLSIADVQWVLHHMDPAGGEVPVVVRRGGKAHNLTLAVSQGWRRAGDVSWRSSTWGLRRMATGGLMLEALPAEERTRLNVPADVMAILVKNVGQYGAHAAAKNAGFQKGDVIVEFDGRTDLINADAVLIHGVTQRKPGDKVAVTVLRNGERKTLQLPMQK